MTTEQTVMVQAVRERARVLFEGKQAAQRSCGIALAEAFGLPTRSYQALRRGFITGAGPCGAVTAGQLILGEYLGYADPAAPVSLQLKEASERYQREVFKRLDRGGSATLTCNDLTRRFSLLQEEELAAFCAGVVATVAEVVAEVLIAGGVTLDATPVGDP